MVQRLSNHFHFKDIYYSTISHRKTAHFSPFKDERRTKWSLTNAINQLSATAFVQHWLHGMDVRRPVATCPGQSRNESHALERHPPPILSLTCDNNVQMDVCARFQNHIICCTGLHSKKNQENFIQDLCIKQAYFEINIFNRKFIFS